jgi:hypothetical protein
MIVDKYGNYVQLDQNSLASEMRTRGNERVSVRQGYGYGCRYGTLNEANLLKTLRDPTDKCAPLVGGISVHCVTGQAVLIDL